MIIMLNSFIGMPEITLILFVIALIFLCYIIFRFIKNR